MQATALCARCHLQEIDIHDGSCVEPLLVLRATTKLDVMCAGGARGALLSIWDSITIQNMMRFRSCVLKKRRRKVLRKAKTDFNHRVLWRSRAPSTYTERERESVATGNVHRRRWPWEIDSPPSRLQLECWCSNKGSSAQIQNTFLLSVRTRYEYRMLSAIPAQV